MNLPLFTLGVLRAHWKLIGLALLLAVVGMQQLRVTGLKSSLTAEKAGRAADRSSYERAQAEAAAKALAVKIETEKRHEAEREKADLAADDLGKQYRAAVLRYQVAQRAAGKPDLSGAAAPAQGVDRPGDVASVPQGSIRIATDDALICAENQGRLEAARAWALSLTTPSPQ